MALVGILTAIDAVEYFLKDNFAMMGSNTFNIQNRELRVHIGGQRHRNKSYEPISYQEAMKFKDEYKYPATASIFTYGTGIATLKYKSEKTNANIQVMGVDENYIKAAGLEIERGRGITATEAQQGSHVVVIASEVYKKLFNDVKEDPIGKLISVGAGKYRIVGILKEKGTAAGFSGDRTCMAPLANVRQYFSRPNMNFR
ncbi:MAG: ABC transporter, partial [Marinilabiliales bacterium]